MRQLILHLTTLVILFAHADLAANQGFYVGAYAGANMIDDQIDNVDFDFDIGFSGALFFGYGCQNGLRLEFEANYRSNHMDEVKVSNIGIFIDGDLEVWSGMINLVYHPRYFCYVNPFLGGGAGIGYERINFIGVDLTPIETVDTRFMYQIVAGLSYEVAPCTELALEYRFLDFDDDSFAHSAGLAMRRFF